MQLIDTKAIRRGKLLLLIAALPSLLGCVVSYTGADGSIHRYGLMAETIQVSGDVVSRADKVAGLRLDGQANGVGLSIGYRALQEFYLVDSENPVCLVTVAQVLKSSSCELLAITDPGEPAINQK